MAKPEPVQLADPRADRPRPATLALIAITAGGCGILVAFGISRALSSPAVPVSSARGALTTHASEPPLEAEAPEEHSISPASSAPPSAATLASAGVQPTPTGAATPTQSAPAAVAPPPSAPENAQPPSVPTPASADAAEPRAESKRAKPTFEPGVLAYVRCEGSELRNARFPCPRDRRLEELVWNVLAQLPNCTDADPGIGSAELRVTLNRSRASFEWKAPWSDPSLDLGALAKCAGAKLPAAHTPARLPHAVVSFKFRLE